MSLLNFFKKRNNDNFSQSGQDQFAYNITGANGVYLEIGAHHPIINSNTYKLEVECGWRGVSVEFDKSFQKYWKEYPERTNDVIWDDAFNIKFENEIKNRNLPKKLIIYHRKRPKRAKITILGFKTNDYKNSGILKLNKNKMLKSYYEKKQKKYGTFANGAIYIFTKISLKKFTKPKVNNLFLDLCTQFKSFIYVYKYHGVFIDIGSLKNYKKIKKYN